MKFLHTADLHLGKRLNERLMLDDQRYVLEQVVDIATGEKVCGVLVAGDVFDRSNPSRDSLELAEWFFGELVASGCEVFVVPGNHDAPQQLSFNASLIDRFGLHIAKAYSGSIDVHLVGEGEDRVAVHLLPFIRPTEVRIAHPDRADEVKSHEDAVRVALSEHSLVEGASNVLVAHQFVTSSGASPETCDSEVLTVGGADSVDASLFDEFDYVALGHLHAPQHVGRDEVRYAGSPLKYSFSEVDHEKSLTLLDIDSDGVQVSTHALEPLHDMREVKASYEELLAGCDALDHSDYVRIMLADRSLPDAFAKVRALYPNVLRLDFELVEPGLATPTLSPADIEELSIIELFADYYELQTGEKLTEDERAIVEACLVQEGSVA